MFTLKYTRAVAAPLFLATAVLFGVEAAAEVKKSNLYPGNSSTLRFPNANYTLTCWQEGKQVLSNQGVGQIALSRDFVEKTVTIASRQNGPVLTIFSTDTALCRLQTRVGPSQ